VAKAEALAAAGHLDQAVQIWNELIVAYEASDRRAGDDLHWATYHSAAYRGIARVLALDGKPAAARVWRDKDAALWESWNRKLPRNVFVVHQLAEANSHREDATTPLLPRLQPD